MYKKIKSMGDSWILADTRAIRIGGLESSQPFVRLSVLQLLVGPGYKGADLFAAQFMATPC